MCIYSEGGMSPVAHSDNNGGTTINEILHETAKYDLKSLFMLLLLPIAIRWCKCFICCTSSNSSYVLLLQCCCY